MWPRIYRLVIRNELDDSFEAAFEGMHLGRRGGCTVLVGQMRDQAQLQGVLARISSLGLDLLSVAVEDHTD